MKLHRMISYSLMTAGAVASARAILNRWQWEENNIHAAIMLDWDDVQAVATRALAISTETGEDWGNVEALLRRFRENGATHLSIPELTLNRLLEKGELSVTQGANTDRVYLRAQNPAIAELVTTELQARLPHLQVRASKAKNPLISFDGDLPTVAEVGLGFDPAHTDEAHKGGLSPVVRPVGYSWVQPEMIERTLDQAAALGARIVAMQGNLIPGHEFKIQSTVGAMRRNRLTYAYFRESGHQKGDWFLAKELAREGLAILAHEFEPPELLEEDWFTISYRWANLAMETGVRLCSVRFFRILHAADPLESLAYIKELAGALSEVGLLIEYAGEVDLTAFQPQRDPAALACAGLSAAGAAGLASDLLPIPDQVKLFGIGAATLILAGLPFLEKSAAGRTPPHDLHHGRNHDHRHDHSDHHLSSKIENLKSETQCEDLCSSAASPWENPKSLATAYAAKGLALAVTVAYPAAAVAINGTDPISSLACTLTVSAAGAITLSATTAETDYLMGIEEYRGFNLDWLIPIGLAACNGLLASQNPTTPTNLQGSGTPAKPPGQISKILPTQRAWPRQRNPQGKRPKSEIRNTCTCAVGRRPDRRKSHREASHCRCPKSIWRWLSLAGIVLAALKNFGGGLTRDLPAAFDREHRYAHTHHLSAFQRTLGDSKMTLSPKPLRKWSLLAPLGAVAAALLKQNGRDELANVALTAVAAGQVATLTGFRNGQRPLLNTLEGRARGWAAGAILAGLVWLVARLFVGRK